MCTVVSVEHQIVLGDKSKGGVQKESRDDREHAGQDKNLKACSEGDENQSQEVTFLTYFKRIFLSDTGR